MTQRTSALKGLILGLLALASANVWASGGEPANYTKTQYPIVMIGGFLAFDDILGINYFYGIPGELRKDGATVYPVNVSAFNGTFTRGEQLIRKLDELRVTTGARKFNLMGHSGGATTIRYVAEVRPDLVASVTSVHGGHKGLPIADVTRKLVPEGGTLEALGFGLVDALGAVVELLSGNDPHEFEQDSVAMLKYYTTEASLEFNEDFSAGVPTTACGEGAYQANGVRYYSWGGTRVFTNALDLMDYIFAITTLFGTEANDGLVGRCSSHLGDVIRDNYDHNHVDAMNHLFGLRGLFSQDPKQLYRQQANRLKNAGL